MTTTLDARNRGLDILGTPGTPLTIRLTFTDGTDPINPASVSAWIGGNDRDPWDFTDATEHQAALDANEATITLTVPTDRTFLRFTMDGELILLGHLKPSLQGAGDGQELTVHVQTGPVEVHLDLPPVPAGLAARVAALEDRLTLLETIAVVYTHQEVPQG